MTYQQYLEEQNHIQLLARYEEIDTDTYQRMMEDLVERYNDSQTQAL